MLDEGPKTQITTTKERNSSLPRIFFLNSEVWFKTEPNTNKTTPTKERGCRNVVMPGFAALDLKQVLWVRVSCSSKSLVETARNSHTLSKTHVHVLVQNVYVSPIPHLFISLLRPSCTLTRSFNVTCFYSHFSLIIVVLYRYCKALIISMPS